MGVWSLPIMTLEFRHSSLISTSLSKSSKSPVSSLSIPSSSSSTIAIFSEGINPKKVGVCQFDTPTPLVFPKMCFLERERKREREKSCLLFTFNIILSQVFPENFIAIPEVVQNI